MMNGLSSLRAIVTRPKDNADQPTRVSRQKLSAVCSGVVETIDQRPDESWRHPTAVPGSDKGGAFAGKGTAQGIEQIYQERFVNPFHGHAYVVYSPSNSPFPHHGFLIQRAKEAELARIREQEAKERAIAEEVRQKAQAIRNATRPSASSLGNGVRVQCQLLGNFLLCLLTAGTQLGHNGLTQSSSLASLFLRKLQTENPRCKSGHERTVIVITGIVIETLSERGKGTADQGAETDMTAEAMSQDDMTTIAGGMIDAGTTAGTETDVTTVNRIVIAAIPAIVVAAAVEAAVVVTGTTAGTEAVEAIGRMREGIVIVSALMVVTMNVEMTHQLQNAAACVPTVGPGVGPEVHLATVPLKSDPPGQDRVRPHLRRCPEGLLQPLLLRGGRDQPPAREPSKPKTMRESQATKNPRPPLQLTLWLLRISCVKGCFVSAFCSLSRVSKVARNLRPRSDHVFHAF